jgi:hypothetical protein
MPNEENMTITETAPDGTETRIEVTTTKPDDAAVGDKSLIEEVYEALFDSDADDDADGTGYDGSDSDSDEDDTTDPAMYGLTPTDDEISTKSAEFNIGRDTFPSIEIPPGAVGTGAEPLPDVAPASLSPDTLPAGESAADAVDPAAIEQQAHADAAKDAQAAADQFVAQGDYKAAEQARETAENEAWEGGDSSMLRGSDSNELETAGTKQQDADHYREQQAYHVEHGDYQAAKEDAQNVAQSTGDADYYAGGSDHTAQADKDVGNLDWAVWDEKNADYARSNAQAYAAEGEFGIAEQYAGQAEGYQANADDYAAHADPASSIYQNQADPSSEVASGGSYESTYDASAVDTGFDAGADAAAAPTYDTSTDDV